ncbi:MAG: FHA domain-containing protein [Planctomycetota bacterium]|jgi:hypothetical protein
MSPINLEMFSQIVRDISRDEFEKRYPHPFLLGTGPAPTAPASRRAFQTMAGFQTADPPTSEAEKDLPVHPVLKSDRNSFRNMITLGRSDNNDIVIEHPSVSKFHAYLQADPKHIRYSICDADSRYGSFVEDRKLRPSTPRNLKGGETLSFGKGARYTYFPSGDFYDYVKVLQGLGKL